MCSTYHPRWAPYTLSLPFSGIYHLGHNYDSTHLSSAMFIPAKNLVKIFPHRLHISRSCASSNVSHLHSVRFRMLCTQPDRHPWRSRMPGRYESYLFADIPFQILHSIPGWSSLAWFQLNTKSNLMSPISEGAPETRSWRDSICLFIRSCRQ